MLRIITSFIMHNNETGPTLLELLQQLEGDIRGRLEPTRVTPLQAGSPEINPGGLISGEHYRHLL